MLYSKNNLSIFAKFKRLQIIVRSHNDKRGKVLLSILIKPKNWQIIESNSALIYLDGKKNTTHDVLNIGLEPFGNFQAIDLIYTHKNFKKIIESDEFKARVEDLVVKIDLKKLPLSKLQLQ